MVTRGGLTYLQAGLPWTECDIPTHVHRVSRCCVAVLQVVDEVFDPAAAEVMGLGKRGTIRIMIHSGSRGPGYQVTHQNGHVTRSGSCFSTASLPTGKMLSLLLQLHVCAWVRHRRFAGAPCGQGQIRELVCARCHLVAALLLFRCALTTCQRVTMPWLGLPSDWLTGSWLQHHSAVKKGKTIWQEWQQQQTTPLLTGE